MAALSGGENSHHKNSLMENVWNIWNWDSSKPWYTLKLVNGPWLVMMCIKGNQWSVMSEVVFKVREEKSSKTPRSEFPEVKAFTVWKLFGVQGPSYWMLAVVGRWETGPLPFLGCAAADIISVDVESAFRFLWVKNRAFGIYGPVMFVILHLGRNARTEAEVVTSQQRWTLTGRPNLELWLG